MTIEQALKEAYKEGQNDTALDQMILEQALLFVDGLGELTDEEQQQVVNAYIQGFISGYKTD